MPYLNPFNDITSEEQKGFGKTGPFDFFMRTSITSHMLRGDPEHQERLAQRLQQEVDHTIGRKLAAHMIAVTKNGKEIVTKIHWHDPVETLDKSFWGNTIATYRVTGYTILANPEEAEVGDYANVGPYPSAYAFIDTLSGLSMWRCGRHVFHEKVIGGLHFFQCDVIMERRPYDGIEYQEPPKEADATWKTVERAKLTPPKSSASND